MKKKIDIKDTTRFSLFFTQGYMMNSDTRYEYELKDDKYIMSIKPYLKDEEETISFEVDKSVIEELEEIFNKYEVYKWDGFHETDKNVLDGDSFSFSLSMNDINISASGYMRYPDNYGYIKGGIVGIYEREMEKRDLN